MWRCRCDSTVVPCWTRSMGIDGPSHLHVKLLRTDITVEPLFFESEIVGLCTILVWSCYRHTASCLHAYLDSLRSTLTGLSVLALPFNTIRDLSLLVDALCNCTPTLQVLDLRHNHIDHEGLTHHFASKLKSFRRLCLSGNPFLDGSPATATTLKILSENTQKSRSMESLLLSPKHKVSFAARHAMNINRGGRRGLSLESSTNLPTIELWPKILHRSLSINYYDVSDDIETPRDESPRSDVVFYLLCHHPTIFDSNNK